MSNMHRATLRTSLRFTSLTPPSVAYVPGYNGSPTYTVSTEALPFKKLLGRKKCHLSVYYHLRSPIPSSGSQCTWAHTGFNDQDEKSLNELLDLLSHRSACAEDFARRYDSE